MDKEIPENQFPISRRKVAEKLRMNRQFPKEIEELEAGDLVCIYWNDASIGSSFTTAGIPVPVKSVGIYVGSVGEPKHAILAQNDFAYNYELRDEDYTAIPQTWLRKVKIIKKAFLTQSEASIILKSILSGPSTRRRRKRIFQMRTQNHELD